jgi:hypothetical protein
MIDTIKFYIKGISENSIHKIKERLTDSLKIHNDTGELISKFTSGTLLGSYDSRISIRVKDQEWKASQSHIQWLVNDAETPEELRKRELVNLLNSKKSTAPVLVPCSEYLEIEFSLSKWDYGVNFFNTPLIDDLRSLYKFRAWLCRSFETDLPPLNTWILRRVDIAENYDFGSLENIKNYVSLWRGLDYPRRKKPTFYAESLYVPGYSTTVKAYAKGPEFIKHDYQRVKAHLVSHAGMLDEDKIALIKQKMDSIKSSIDGIFRFEVEFHKRKLEAMQVIKVIDLFKIDWVKEMKKEISKLIGEAPKTKIYTLPEVTQKIVFAQKNGYLAGKGVSKASMIGIYTAIVTHGDKYAKETFNSRQVQRVKKVLKGLNISFLSTLTDHEKTSVITNCDIKQFNRNVDYKSMRKFQTAIKFKCFDTRSLPAWKRAM